MLFLTNVTYIFFLVEWKKRFLYEKIERNIYEKDEILKM